MTAWNKTKDLFRWARKSTSFGDVLAVASFSLSVYALINNKSLQRDATIYLFGFFLLILFLLFVWREVTYSRKARYAEAIRTLHDCAHEIRDSYSAIEGKNEELFKRSIRSSLAAFSSAFSIVTGASCRACIKVITHDDSEDPPVFYTETLQRNKKIPRTQNKDEPAKIEYNTDFNILFTTSDEENYFFEGNLVKRRDYKNSNWPYKHDEREAFLKDKKYKYVSTIVWPIREREGDDAPKVIGFLCIDSMARNAFLRRYDIDFGATIADVLYPVLLEYRKAFS